MYVIDYRSFFKERKVRDRSKKKILQWSNKKEKNVFQLMAMKRSRYRTIFWRFYYFCFSFYRQRWPLIALNLVFILLSLLTVYILIFFLPNYKSNRADTFSSRRSKNTNLPPLGGSKTFLHSPEKIYLDVTIERGAL